MNIYFVTAKEDLPLEQLLLKCLPGGDKEDIRRVILAGGVWRERERLTDCREIVKQEETVRVYTEPGQEQEYREEPGHIVFENRDFLVAYKPGDLNVHAAPSSLFFNLAHGIDKYLQSRGIAYRSTPLTRLDRPAAGLVIFAAHKEAERELFGLVKSRRIKKWYLAAVAKSGDGEGRRHRLAVGRLRIQDHISNREKRTAPDPNGKPADSLFIKREERGIADIHSVFTFTGRRHQVRFHASHYIAPILGDRLYGSPYRFGRNEIALLCCGYNIPFGGRNYRVRLPKKFIDIFYTKIDALASKNGADK